MLLDVAFPPTCPACHRGMAERLGRSQQFCDGCEADLALLEGPLCVRCSAPTSTASHADCPACRGERWAFDATLALGPYEGLLRRLILDAKQPAGEAAAAAIGQMLARRHAERLAALPGAVVTPVPQHWRRRLLRRCDGVAALSVAFAQGVGLPFQRLLSKRRPTRRQTEVAPSDRRSNVRGAFGVNRPGVTGKTVLLVDDVLTTGSTCHAAAQMLKRAGADRVVAVVAARRLGSF